MAYSKKPDLRPQELQQFFSEVNIADAEAVAAALRCAQRIMTGYAVNLRRQNITLKHVGIMEKRPVESLSDLEITEVIAAICAKVCNALYFFNFDGGRLNGVVFIGLKKDLPLTGMVYDFLGESAAAAKKRYWKKNKEQYERGPLNRLAQQGIKRSEDKAQVILTALNLGVRPVDLIDDLHEDFKELPVLTKNYIKGGFLHTVNFKTQAFVESLVRHRLLQYKDRNFPMLEKLGGKVIAEKLDLKKWRYVLRKRLKESAETQKKPKEKIDFKTKVLNIFNSYSSQEGYV